MSEEMRNEILEKIKEEHITPKPRWSFLLKEYLLWVVGVISVFIGSLATSVVFFHLKNNDWDITSQLAPSKPLFLLGSMPYLWLVVLGVFILLANYQVHHTKRGYRYPVYAVVMVIVGASLLGGMTLHVYGAGKAVNERLAARSALYRQFGDPRASRWENPREGRLAGSVIEVNEKEIILMDFSQIHWRVLPPEVPLLRAFQPEVGQRIRVLGVVLEPGVFEAKQVLPWELDPRTRDRLKNASETKIREMRTTQ